MRGGPNRGQGRKPLPPGEKRQPVTVRLMPSTVAWLRRESARLRISYGELIERIIGRRD